MASRSATANRSLSLPFTLSTGPNMSKNSMSLPFMALLDAISTASTPPDSDATALNVSGASRPHFSAP